MSLLPVPQNDTGPRVYCGPTAISGVTGVPPSEVVWAVQRLRGSFKRPVVGMDEYEVCNTLGYLGWYTRVYIIVPNGSRKRVQLGRYFCQEDPAGPCIAATTNHYVVTDGVEALCNWTNGEPVLITEHPHFRANLKTVIYVEPRR